MGYKSRPFWKMGISFCKCCGVRLPDDNESTVCQECSKGTKGVLYERKRKEKGGHNANFKI